MIYSGLMGFIVIQWDFIVIHSGLMGFIVI